MPETELKQRKNKSSSKDKGKSNSSKNVAGTSPDLSHEGGSRYKDILLSGDDTDVLKEKIREKLMSTTQRRSGVRR